MKAGYFSLVVVAVLVTAAGCSDGRFEIAPVSGVISINGEPIKDAHINFEPRASGEDGLAGVGSYGDTDSEGRYELKTLDNETGAVVASHRVTIRTFVGEGGPNGSTKVIRKELLPKKYHSSSKLTFEVPAGGTDQANFDLTTE
jgi:hypothetical protein